MPSNVKTKATVDIGQASAANNDFIDIANLIYNLIPVDRNTVKASYKALVWLNDLKSNPCVRDNWLTELQGFVAGLWACGVISNDDVLSFKGELEQRNLRVIPENFDYLNDLKTDKLTVEQLNQMASSPRRKPTPAEHKAKLEIIKNLRTNRLAWRQAAKRENNQGKEA